MPEEECSIVMLDGMEDADFKEAFDDIGWLVKDYEDVICPESDDHGDVDADEEF